MANDLTLQKWLFDPTGLVIDICFCGLDQICVRQLAVSSESIEYLRNFLSARWNQHWALDFTANISGVVTTLTTSRWQLRKKSSKLEQDIQ